MKNIKTTTINILIFLIPILSVLLQGLYNCIFTALALTAILVLSPSLHISKKTFFTALLMVFGMILSDAIAGFKYNFVYEIPKVLLMFATISIVTPGVKKKLIWGLYAGCSISSFIGIVAWIFNINYFDLTQMFEGKIVVQGILGYANTTSVLCSVGVLLAIFFSKQNENFKFMNEILCLINIVCLILTDSIFGVLSLMSAIIIALCTKYSKLRKYVFTLVILFILFVFYLFTVKREAFFLQSTVACRLIYWYDAIKAIIKSPLGIGVGNWQNIQYSIQTANYSVKYVHNGYIQILLDGGIVALTGLLFLLITNIRYIITKYKATNERVFLYILTILFVIVFHSFVDIDFAYGCIWLILGIVMNHSEKGYINFNKIISVSFAVILVCILLVLPQKNASKLQILSDKFSIAMKNNNYQSMDEISERWIKTAPRQQAAYDARYISLMKLNKTDEIDSLKKQVDNINSSMNYLCKYLSAHKEIVLPTGGIN